MKICAHVLPLPPSAGLLLLALLPVLSAPNLANADLIDMGTINIKRGEGTIMVPALGTGTTIFAVLALLGAGGLMIFMRRG